MSRFTVVWLRSTTDQLAEIWTDAPNQAAVSAAAGAIDRILAETPLDVGEDVHEGLRRLGIGPVEILYGVREEDRLVKSPASEERRPTKPSAPATRSAWPVRTTP